MQRWYISITVFLMSIILLPLRTTRAAERGYNFIDEARFIYTVAACGDDNVPADIDPTAVARHCARLKPDMERYRREFADRAGPFIAKLRPAHIPCTVVYPFGGTDVFAALVTYPDAREITTISLESAGDPRRLRKAAPAQMRTALDTFSTTLGYLLRTNDSSNTNVRVLERGIMPNQLSFALSALALFGYEPVSLKYFRINPDGSLHYFSPDEIASMEHSTGARLAPWWVDTDFSVAFRNMELTFRAKGANRNYGTVVYRHIAANLCNADFAASPLRAHLENKGKISVLTKAASYLLWRDDFSVIRNYLLSHMEFMVSDSTGILPRHAKAAGFTQAVYGRFYGAFLDNEGGADAAELRALWQSQPYRPLPFRYGYSDTRGASHLMITLPAKK